MDKVNELKELLEKVEQIKSEIRPQVETRMAQIEREINALVQEGVTLSDGSGITFSLAGLDFLPYGAGELRYRPDTGEINRYGDSYTGWRSSSSDC